MFLLIKNGTWGLEECWKWMWGICLEECKFHPPFSIQVGAGYLRCIEFKKITATIPLCLPRSFCGDGGSCTNFDKEQICSKNVEQPEERLQEHPGIWGGCGIVVNVRLAHPSSKLSCERYSTQENVFFLIFWVFFRIKNLIHHLFEF